MSKITEQFEQIIEDLDNKTYQSTSGYYFDLIQSGYNLVKNELSSLEGDRWIAVSESLPVLKHSIKTKINYAIVHIKIMTIGMLFIVENF
jgi:hypothetical protein